MKTSGSFTFKGASRRETELGPNIDSDKGQTADTSKIPGDSLEHTKSVL